MAIHNTLVRVHAHEQLACFGKLHQKIMVMRDELQHWFIMAEVAQITEDRYEPLVFEWVAVDIYLCTSLRLEDDTFVLDLIGEKGSDDHEETRNEVVVSDDVKRNGGDCEKLWSKIFNRGLGFSIDE
jgi:hypothetical protein